MSITVNKLYKNGTLLYNMKLLAGYKGLNNLVQWVHIMEDDDASKFLHGNELVFTAGILNNHNDWLLEFVKKLYTRGISAFVVNIGPHTKDIPSEVMSYCNQVDLPLFTIPWETRMVDMTRDFCHRIVQNEQVETSMATIVKNIIFKTGNMEADIQQLERYGYRRDISFAVIGMDIDCQYPEHLTKNMDRLKFYTQKTARNLHDNYISFSYEASYIIILAEYSDNDIKVFINQLQILNHRAPDWSIYMGISPNKEGVINLSSSFEKAISALNMSHRMQDFAVYYDELGLYKVLLSTSDKSVLRDFYREVLGKLVKIDRENNTQYIQLLHTYVECNGSPRIMAEKMYIHRNTVNYQLKKIEKITGLNPANMDDRMKIMICFYISDVI